MIKIDFTKVPSERPPLFDEFFIYEHENNEPGQVAQVIAREPGNIDFLKRELKPGMNFVDVGGYEGYFSVIAAKLGAGRIFTFEPVFASVEIIKANMELHHIKGMEVFHAAISNKVEFANVIWRPGLQCCSKIYENPNDHNSHYRDLIQTFSLDFLQSEVFKDTPIHIMKVDIEGAEVDLFDGAKEFFDRNKGCKVMLELHCHYIRDRSDVSLFDFLNQLLYDFDIYGFNMEPYPQREFDKLYHNDGTNLILVHK